MLPACCVGEGSDAMSRMREIARLSISSKLGRSDADICQLEKRLAKYILHLDLDALKMRRHNFQLHCIFVSNPRADAADDEALPRKLG